MNERDKKVIIKITGKSDERVKFRCVYEDSEYNIDDMPEYNFDLVNLTEVDTMDKLLKEIGRSAWMVAARQELAENIKKQPVGQLDLSSLIDQEIALSLSDIYKDENKVEGTEVLYITSDENE